MKLSVVVPCRNSAATLGQQLEALTRERWDGGFDVVVVLNRTTDNSASVASKYVQRLSSLCVIEANDRDGSGYARNCGVRASTGDAILFCDADDEIGEGWLSAMGEALSKHDFVACRVDLDKLNEPRIRGPHPQNTGLQRLPYPPYVAHAGSGTLGVKRWIHDAVGGFDERFRFVEDVNYCLKIQLAGHPLEFAPAAVVHVRVRAKLKDVFRQARRWGQYSVLNYRVARSTLGTDALSRPWRLGFNAWRGLFRTLPSVREARARRTWVFQFGYRTGRLIGTIRYLTAAP